MKKLAKPLILLLVVSLLAGAFIFNVLAEDSTSTGAVGSYTQPEGSWTVPTEDNPDTEADETAIVFGVWAAEADFLAGKAPDYWYTDGEFTGARIGTTDTNGLNYGVADYKPGYVHCFGDVTNSTAQIITGQKQTLVINLAGHTLANAKGFRIGGASGAKTEANVTFKNGTINHTGGQIQARGNSHIKYENVVYNHKMSTPMLDDDGHSYMGFKDCYVETTSTATVFNINANANSVDSTIDFINTDLVCKNTQTYPLFNITSPAGKAQTKTATIFFDKDSSLTRSSATSPLVSLNAAWLSEDGVFGSFSAIQYVNFELGFKYSESTLPTTFTYFYKNMSSGKFSAVKTSETLAVGADNYLVVNVLNGEETVTDYVMYLKDGMYEIKKTPSAEDAWTPAEDSGIKYAVWSSEAAYLFGDEPISSSTSEVLAVPADSAYVHCFADIKVSSQVDIATGKTVTINLGGKTMAQSQKIQIIANATLTVKNGNWTHSGGQNQGRSGSTLIVENVNMTRNSGDFGFDYGTKYIRFTNCTINTANANFVFANATNDRTLVFENTDVIFTGTRTNALFNFKVANNVNITFDGDSSIIGNVVTWYTGAELLGDKVATINFEDGFAASEGTTYPTSEGSVVVNKGKTVEICAHVAGEPEVTTNEAQCGVAGSTVTVTKCTKCGEVLSEVTEEIPALEHKFGSDLKCEYCGEDANPWTPNENYADIKYGAWESELDYLLGNEPKWFSTSDVLDTALIGATDKSVGLTYTEEGFIPGYVHVYADVKNDAYVIIGRVQKLTINLGGKTWTQSQPLQVGGPSGTSLPDSALTVKNGNWVSTAQIQCRIDTSLILDGVNLTKASGEFGIYYGAGYVKYTDCTINTTSGYFELSQANKKRVQIIFENTDIIYSAKPTGAIFRFANANFGYVDITFDANSSVQADIDNWYSVADGVTLNDGAVNFTFEDGFSIVEGNELPTVAEEYAGKITVNAGTPEYITYLIKIYDKNGNLIGGWMDAVITGNADGVLSNVPNGATIKLFADATAGAIHTYSDYSLTIDLNGYTLTFTTSTNMQLGHSMSGSWKERVITFTSSNGRGTIDALARTGNTFQTRPGSIVLFENLDITIGCHLFNDGGAKSITMKNCTLTSKNSNGYFANTSGLGTHDEGVQRTYNFDNTAIYGMGIVYNYPNALDNLTINFTNGCILDNAKADMFYFGKNDGSINAKGNKIVNISADTKFTNFNLDLVTVIGNEATVKFNVLDGETAVTNYAVWSSGEYYVIGEKTTVTGFSANLTLFSDFNLNFFGAENIAGVYYNGALLESMPYGEKTKFTLAGITPDTAADTLKFTVAVAVGDETCYMTLNYSVLKYAEKAVQTTEKNGAELVTAVMNYVKAAYVYTGKAAPEFDGVDYTVEIKAPDTAFAHPAISGVQLVLDTEIGVKFNLNASYNGTVKIGDATYEVVNGEIAEGINYVVYNARAYQFANGGIAVADAETTAVYTLADYVAWANTTSDTNLVNLVTALYEYSYYANEYKKNN